MTEVVPFKGILYNVSKISSIEEVLAPPYDIIAPEYKEALYKRNPFNIVRIDYGKDMPGDNEINNRYSRARKYLNTWMHKGILIQSKKPSFYVYTMTYEINNQKKQLVGFLGLLRLEELGRGSIYPHECTYSTPKRDRLELLRSCNANISPIFSLYKSTEGQVTALFTRIIKSSKPYFELKDADGAIHRLWQVDKKKDITTISKELENKQIFIADGHHRYETALEYQREMKARRPSHKGKEAFDYVLMFFANILDKGLTILPTHRLVKEVPRDINTKLSEYFHLTYITDNFDIAKRLSEKKNVFGFFSNDKNGWYLLQYKDNLSEINPNIRDIDVIILHEVVFKKILQVTEIGYEMDLNKALEKVRKRQYGAAFFLNPTQVADVEKAAFSSVRMPPKSTYFYPKLLTGVVINSFSHNDLSG